MGQNLISNDDVVIAANEPITAGGTVDDSSGDIILRTGGVERARIDKSGLGSGLFGALPDVTASAATGVAATDTTNLQAAIDATPSGGFLLIPGGTYIINAALAVTKHIRLEGRASLETWSPSGSGGGLDAPVSPGVSGTVIKQSTAATDVLQLSGSAISAQVRNLGLTFAAGIINTNTGHGLSAYPTLANGSGHDSGLMGFVIENVSVYGHDGNHYAFRLRNELYGKLSHLRGYGGGGLFIDCDSFVGNFGNLQTDDLYFQVTNAGTAGGIMLSARVAAGGGSSGQLNLIEFVGRTQVIIEGAAATAGTQYFFNSLAGAALPSHVSLNDPDFEGAGGNPINFGGVNSGTVVRMKAGILATAPAGGFDSENGYTSYAAAGTFTFVCPIGVYKTRVRCVGGGGGGGGGGTNASAAANTGGGGGGAGMVAEAWVSTTPGASYTVVVGAAGTAGGGGASGGAVGTAGGTGGQSSFNSNTVKAAGGGGGAGGPASGTATARGGNFGRSGQYDVGRFSPGAGAPSLSSNGQDAIPMPPGVAGGGAGGPSNTTLGGGGGGGQSAFPCGTSTGGGQVAASGTSNGVAGTAAVGSGCGGGGGGGAPSGGTGGAGAAGAPGLVEIAW